MPMSAEDWLAKTAKRFPKTIRVSPDLKSSEIRKVFGQEFAFVRVPFQALGYHVLGFKNEFALTTFCKKFARHLISEGDQT